MIKIISLITVICLLVPIYVYIGYPLLLVILSRVIKLKLVNRKDITPKVSLIVSCYNEVDVIDEKVDNCLIIDYPEELIEFIFISDGSTDGTDEHIHKFKNDRLKLVRQEGRLGKTSGLNLGVPIAKGDIIVFSDANAMYDKQAIRKLVRNFADEKIGYVVGAALYLDSNETSSAKSEDIYWQYEIFVKKIESSLHSVVGGDGAIYAIRSHLYEQLKNEDINDFVNPLQIIAKGYRGVFEEEAVCFEKTTGDFEKESKRKKRIVNRSFTALIRNKKVLNPLKYGIFSLEIISHKLLRWLIPFFIIVASMGILILSQAHILFFQICLLLGIVGIWFIILGSWLKHYNKCPGVVLYPYYFYLVNKSAFFGVIESMRRRVQVTWSTHREESLNTASGSPRKLVNLSVIILFMVTIWLFQNTIFSIK